jgi:NAD(P)H-dependent flavin oxidoreductase YrpB (nitropropane dioxygenase family)
MVHRLHTALCETLGIEVPICQAPIGSAGGPELAAAVSGAGGLGSMALTWTSIRGVRAHIQAVRAAAPDRPFAANFVLDFPVEDILRAALDEGVPIISTFWGDPATVHDHIAAAGALHLHTVGSVDEARRAVGAGVDVVVAQGWEAGGHVRGSVTTLCLVPDVVDAITPVPVIAAGGIADGRALAAVLTLGAGAAWLGTRFVAAEESRAHDVYRREILRADAQRATYTQCFDGGWPDAPHRVLRNSTLTVWEAAGRPTGLARPGVGDVLAREDNGSEQHRYDDTPPLRGMTGDLEALALYAGQGVALIDSIEPAAGIIERIASEALAALRGREGF